MNKVPGVYVDEENKVRLSVTTGATAVPAFVFAKADFGGDGHYKRFNSWLAVIEGLPKDSDQMLIYRSLKIYFENGG